MPSHPFSVILLSDFAVEQEAASKARKITNHIIHKIIKQRQKYEYIRIQCLDNMTWAVRVHLEIPFYA